MPNRILAMAAVLTLAATGCGLVSGQEAATPPPAPTAPQSDQAQSGASPSDKAGKPESGKSAEPQPLASTRSTMTESLKIDVIGLNRYKSKHLVAQLRLSNTGTEDLPWTGQLGDHTRELGAIRWASGIGVLDHDTRTWLLPYQPADSPCLCTDQQRDGLDYAIEPGASITVYAVLPAPSGSTTTVVTPAAPPMPGVPISDEPPAGDFPDPDAQPVTPVTRKIVLPSESLDKSEETADDGQNLQVNLSSDVLFAVDKATLTPRARTVLARTAKLIDASPATTVEVAGHADSSGNDAINDPLSRRRAQAVQRALAGLLTRDGVRFQAKGYGSRRPLYPNESDEGRRRNRRVTVTFAKAQPPAEPAPEPAATTRPGAAGLTGSTRVKGQEFALEVTGLRRLPGGMGLLTYTVTNKGDAETWFNELHHAPDWQAYKYQAAGNVRLTDVAARRQYLPGRLQVPTDAGTDAYCACTDVSGVRLSTEKYAPGQVREFWGLFALPDTAAELKVAIGPFRPLQVAVG
ncbi:OmpA family protein [Nonomuraea sp. NPDC050328]|uniref:OmpA family protein n=1 Tax=Nonomuraea sp. NPDC050328 TaxID=3364361 RepID=UPI0037A53C81